MADLHEKDMNFVVLGQDNTEADDEEAINNLIASLTGTKDFEPLGIPASEIITGPQIID